MPLPTEATAPAAAAATSQAGLVRQADLALAPYLGGLPYDEGRIVSEIRNHFVLHSLSGFEIGRRLIALRERTQNGRFQEIVQDELHMSPRRARELMCFAKLIIDLKSKANDAVDFEQLQRMSDSKLRLLGEVIPEHLEELEESGTLAGRKFEYYDSLSRTELRKEIEKLRKDKEAGIESVSNWKKKAHDAEQRIDKLKAATDENVLNQCTRLRSSFSDAANLFQNCLIVLKAPEASTLAEIHATKQFVLAQAGALVEYIDTLYPNASEAARHADNNLAAAAASAGIVGAAKPAKGQKNTAAQRYTQGGADPDPTEDMFSGLADEDQVPGLPVVISYSEFKDIARLALAGQELFEISDAIGLTDDVIATVLTSQLYKDFTSGIQPVPSTPPIAAVKGGREA